MYEREILDKLKQYIDSKQKEDNNKATVKLLEQLGRIGEKDISFGENPEYFYANIACNSTGVGNSTFGDTETRRTVSLDYVTDEYLFLNGHEGAGLRGLNWVLLKPGQTVEYYRAENADRPAKRFGYILHSQNFSDINMSLTDHRLNRYALNITKGPFKIPIYPIYAENTEYCEKFTIGYVYKKDDKDYIVIEPEDPKLIGKKENKSGCSPWMFLGFIFPPVLVVAFVVYFMRKGKQKAEQMMG